MNTQPEIFVINLLPTSIKSAEGVHYLPRNYRVDLWTGHLEEGAHSRFRSAP